MLLFYSERLVILQSVCDNLCGLVLSKPIFDPSCIAPAAESLLAMSWFAFSK